MEKWFSWMFLMGFIQLVVFSWTREVPLVLYYDMEARQQSGPIMDQGPWNINGILRGECRILPEGKRGSGLFLDNPSARFVFGEHLYLNSLTHNFSLTMWCKPLTFSEGDTTHLVTKRSGWWQVKPFSLEMDRQGRLGICYHDGEWKTVWSKGPIVQLNTWQHVALTVQEKGVIALYHNGELVFQVPLAKRLTRSAEPFQLGGEEGGNFPGGRYTPYRGWIDEFKIYAVVLTPEEVILDMENKLAVRPSKHEDFPKRGISVEDIPSSVRETPKEGEPLECYIIFDREPKAKGMWFHPLAAQPTLLKNGNQQLECWVAQGNSFPGVPWGRSFYFVITDPRFKNGQMPAVDIEIEFALPAWSGVDLYADTRSGPTKVWSGWGNNQWFKRIHLQLHDAFFGERDMGNPEKTGSCDGYDLRFNGFTSDLYIRSIRIKGYDLDNHVDYRRLLVWKDTLYKDGPFLFEQGKTENLTFIWENLSRRRFQGEARYRIMTHDGEKRHDETRRLDIPAQSKSELMLAINTTGYEYGIYYLEMEVVNLEDQSLPIIWKKTTAFGVHNKIPIPKARDGEFLYGLDVRLGSYYRDPILLKWVEWLGCDILRGGAHLNELDEALPIFRQRGLKVMPVVDPPYHQDRGIMDKELKELCQRLETIAKKYPELVYWELGNEPNLEFFYRGSMEDYISVFSEMYRAIKRGNARTVVMNGGLAYAGSERERRRFFEYIEKQPIDLIDAWAYHGHGPLVHAEREAYTRIYEATKRVNKHHKLFIETESGVSAKTREQEKVQARTCIQKMVYGQSIGLPLFMWFRLLFEEPESYGNLYSPKEPRPVILAYRTLTQQLKHHRFVSRLNIEKDVLEGYVFQQPETRRTTLVLWSNETMEHTLPIRLGKGKIEGVKCFNLYGNPLPIRDMVDSYVQIEVNENPIFVTYISSEKSDFPVLVPPVFFVQTPVELVRGKVHNWSIKVRNPLSGDVQATVSVVHQGEDPLQFPGGTKRILNLKSSEIQEIVFPIEVPLMRKSSHWPEEWILFTEVLPDLDLTRWDNHLPNELPGTTASGKANRRVVLLSDFTIDIAHITGEIRERKPAIIGGIVESFQDQEIEIGTSADWWMEWYINGRKVYDTLATGNGGGYSITDHVFKATLRKGKNLIMVRVLSGSQGWKLLIANPDVLKQVRKGGSRNILSLVFQVGQNEISKESFFYTYIPFIPFLNQEIGKSITQPIQNQAFNITLSQIHVTNPFELLPDQKKWWKGEQDLSLKGWIVTNSTTLYLMVEVRDDDVQWPTKISEFHQGDSVVLGISKNGKEWNEYLCSLVGSNPVVNKQVSNWGIPKGEVKDGREIQLYIEKGQEKITYHIRVSKDILPREAVVYLNLAAIDNDGGERRQWIQWRPGLVDKKDPRLWYRVWLP